MLKVSIEVDENIPCMTFTPQLFINNTNAFRWVVTFLAKWFLAGEHRFQFLPLENGTKTRYVEGECFTGHGVGLWKLMLSVLYTGKGFITMNEAVTVEAQAKVTEKLV